VAQLPPERFRIFLTGRTPEREALLAEAPALLTRPGVVDLMGRMSLDQMIAFVGAVDGLVGNSTGPLHIAGALGRHTLGLFPGATAPIRRSGGRSGRMRRPSPSVNTASLAPAAVRPVTRAKPVPV